MSERLGAFLDRPLEGEWPYLWLDATDLKQREGGRIVSVAAINDEWQTQNRYMQVEAVAELIPNRTASAITFPSKAD